jgi:mycothiol synthase
MIVMRAILPANFSVRRPTFADLPVVVEMIRAGELAENGHARLTEGELRNRWESPGFDLAVDGWLVIAPDGRVAASVTVGHRPPERMYVAPRVHPDYAGQGFYAYLLELASERARDFIAEAQEDARVTLNTNFSDKNNEAHQALLEAGFAHIRSEWLMEIVMDVPPPEPVWAEGLELRPYTSDMLTAVYEADDNAFQDHWGRMPIPFDLWQTWNNKHEGFDPSLWFLVFDGQEIAAIALCMYEGDEAWVGELGVRRPWRRKGLGLALLYQAFGEFYRRGTRRVILNVDAQSLTGATRLYTRAGMHPFEQHNNYQCELRPGRELATEALVD